MTRRRSLSRAQRVRIFDAHNGICHICGLPIQVNEKWDVEHVRPLGLDGADDSSNWRPAHRDTCHKEKTKTDRKSIDKAVRQRARHLGIRKRQSRPMAGSRDSGWKHKMDGTWERRT